MKLDDQASADVIDKRSGHLVVGAFALLSMIAGLLGLTVRGPADPDADLVAVVSTALDRGQAWWSPQVPNYRHAKVVLYERSTPTACGLGETASGPFYCPGDERIYIDLSFLRAIRGELARAYVIAHELGHHVQKLRAEYGGTSIEVELGADCYAGEWIAREQADAQLDAGDVPAALAEAAAVGDDRLCPTCSPEQWTHGSAQQRVAAVTAGTSGLGCHR